MFSERSDRFPSKMMTSLSPDTLLAIEAAKSVGEILLTGFGSPLQFQVKKGEQGIVTELDPKAEKKIRNVLSSGSSYAFHGEESGITPGSGELYWVVDPLDGTNNRSRSLPAFAASIALMRGSEILVGVIYNPLFDALYCAEKGKGAFLNGQSIGVSKPQSYNQPLVFVNTGYSDESHQRAAIIQQRLGNRISVRKFGTSAAELCYVARGSAEAWICSGDELWDFAAGLVIVEEAGGVITDWRGDPWNSSHSFTIASNGPVGEMLVEHARDLQVDN